MIYIIIGGVIILILVAIFIYKNINQIQSDNINFEKIQKVIQVYGFKKQVISDMTVIGLPIPLKPSGDKLPVAFILYYSTPSEEGNHTNPNISLPFGLITVDAKNNEVLAYDKKEVDNLRVLANAPVSLVKEGEATDNYLKTIENLKKISPQVFELYWKGEPQSEEAQVQIKEYIKLSESLTPIPLISEYRKINPDFFAWLSKINN